MVLILAQVLFQGLGKTDVPVQRQCSIQLFRPSMDYMRPTHTREGFSLFNLLMHILISLRNILTDTSRNDVYIWAPCGPIKLTQINHHNNTMR